jgi:hypothetical protein
MHDLCGDCTHGGDLEHVSRSRMGLARHRGRHGRHQGRGEQLGQSRAVGGPVDAACDGEHLSSEMQVGPPQDAQFASACAGVPDIAVQELRHRVARGHRALDPAAVLDLSARSTSSALALRRKRHRRPCRCQPAFDSVRMPSGVRPTQTLSAHTPGSVLLTLDRATSGSSSWARQYQWPCRNRESQH